ncbi:MAG: ligase-associated DNA damage response DEXH box helicase [Planctomycetota bacterium]|nr:ligase-associated DNA damage response DEXH box helicase [Planctomycetota bacterium]
MTLTEPEQSPIEGWFAARGWSPFAYQREAWSVYAAGRSGLIHVPTGAGKTYAAYMGPLAQLIAELGVEASVVSRGTSRPARAQPAISAEKPPVRSVRPKRWTQGLRLLYVTPLRAVAHDVELALRRPVLDLGLPFSVETRTGDTPASVRARQSEKLPTILITTPESLSLLISRENAREQLGGVRCVIVDEWHELLSSKRGTQVELAMARLRRFAPGVRTWALSATIANVEEAAQAAVGMGHTPVLVRAEIDRPIFVESVLPKDPKRLPWAGHLGLSMLEDVVAALDPAFSTLIFCNTRSQAERWYQAIRFSKPEWQSVLALHHGSIDRAERARVEAGLKDGTVRLVVATSSLDLGVDFAPVERVMQIGSPKGVARLVQRAGRSGHRPGAACRVLCVPTHGLELVEIAAVRRAIQSGHLERRDWLEKPLDVLAQHMVTCALGGGFAADELFEEVRTTLSYRELTRQEFEWALQLVQEGGRTLQAYPDFHKVKLVDGLHRVPEKRLGTLHRLNIGTITGDGTLDLKFRTGKRLGSIEEHFIAHLKEGDRFFFAGKTLEFLGMHDLTAYVRQARGKASLTPIWGGTRLPISESLGEAVREALERAAQGDRHEEAELQAGARIIAAQRQLSHVPAADEVLAEIHRTREGLHVFVFPFEGRLVHAGIAALLAYRLSRRVKATFATASNDYGFELLTSDTELPVRDMLDVELFSVDRLLEDVAASIELSRMARLQFREVARVAGLVFVSHPGAKKTARQLQASSGLIFDVFEQFDPENLLLEQARREVIDRQFERTRLARTLARLRESKLVVREPAQLTPLGFPLVIERTGARLTSQTLLERVAAITKLWEEEGKRGAGKPGRVRRGGDGV